MNVFEYAKKMELDGINYYRKEAELTKHSGFKEILKLLIRAEQKHYDFFDSLQKDCAAEKLPKFPDEKVKNIFQQMMKDKENFDFSEEEVEIYRKALEIEERSEKFYRDEAEKAENAKVKEQLLQIADEESKHRLIVDGMVECINRPNQWVEHAMFSWLRPEY
jgi:rubrerythrin